MAEGKKVAAGCGPCAIDDLQKNQGQAFEHCQHGSARRPLAHCAERCEAWESEGTAVDHLVKTCRQISDITEKSSVGSI